MDFYVYLLKRPDGSPFYVGKGRGNRCTRHAQNAYLLKDPNLHKVNVIKKIIRSGLKPVIEIVQSSLTEHDAFELEKKLISQYGRFHNGGVLTNCSDGGEGQSGFKLSLESRKKLSRPGALNPFFGKKHDPESLEKIGSANRGKCLSPEWRSRLSKSLIGSKKSQEHKDKIRLSLIGKKHSHEHTEKCARSHRGKRLSQEHKDKIRAALVARFSKT